MVNLEDLGIKHKPSEKIYKNIMKLSYFLVDHVFKDSFEFFGAENLREDCYQLFLCDHKFYSDPAIAQIAIALASDNDKPIPAPAYKAYIQHKALGPLMAALFSYPIFNKRDGDEKKEKSLEYSVESFLQQERILIFPEGRISHDGLLGRSKIGSAEIAWRAYHKMQANPELSNKKKGMKIVPMEISYYPIAGLPMKDMKKMTVRFGKSMDVEEELIKKYYSGTFQNKEARKKSLQMKLMLKVGEEIGKMETINLEEVASRALYELVKLNYSSIKNDDFKKVVHCISDALANTPGLYLLGHLSDRKKMESAYKRFIKRCKKKEVIKIKKGRLNIDSEYVLSKPEFKDVRNDNFILYNYNLLEHMGCVKAAVESVLGKRGINLVLKQ